MTRTSKDPVTAWSARGGEVQFELGSPSLRLLADEGQLEQALLALFQNAERATASLATPRLWVQARQGRGGRLQITRQIMPACSEWPLSRESMLMCFRRIGSY